MALAASWPRADFIIGNPPFLGSKQFRKWGLSDEYLDRLFAAYDLPKTSDLCCYWFELGRRAIEKNPGTRVGLLATQGIRGGDNRTVLERIKKSGDIFMAWADRDWILDGAAVHVSLVGFDGGSQRGRALDGRDVTEINPDLTTGVDTSTARPLAENRIALWSIGTQKGGSFDIDLATAASMLGDANPHGRPNADVVRPWWNASDITNRWRGLWIVDFGCERSKEEAAKFESPFSYVERAVYPERKGNRRPSYRDKWWIHQEPRAELRGVIEAPVQLLTPRVSKHRVWIRSGGRVLADCALVSFRRTDDYFFGMLQSSLHDRWARSTGTQLREADSGFRYTPTSTFETFPLPWPPGNEPTPPKAKHHGLWKAISEAAAELDRLREAWLNPPEWIAECEKQVDVRHRADLAAVPADVRPLVRRSAVMGVAAEHPKLKLRTLTNLYNERPAWLRLAHQRLDKAVLGAYRAVDQTGGAGAWTEEWAGVYEPYGAGEIVIRTEGKGRDSQESAARKRAAIAAREPVDARILGNLLRLNHERAGA